MTPPFRRSPAEAAIDMAYRAVDQSGQLPERRWSSPTARHRGVTASFAGGRSQSTGRDPDARSGPEHRRGYYDAGEHTVAERGLLLELGNTNTTDSLPAGVGRVIARLTEAADPDAHPAIGTDTGAASDVDRILIRPDG